MTLDQQIRDQLAARDLRALFLEHLGWDQPGIATVTIELDDVTYEAIPVAQKRGLHVFEVTTTPDVPTADLQHHIDAEVAHRLPERLLVFSSPSRQVWRWPQPRNSGGVKLIPHEIAGRSVPTAIVQRLAGVRFSLAEEDSITLPQVKDRVRTQFNSERITNRFYERFQQQHTSLQAGLEGIEGETENRWYASVLMNRLMFIYFLQKKGFLNGDRDYLSTCLTAVRRIRGDNAFYAFYREVLLPMFHDGFGSAEHNYADPEIARIIGDIPYVNGGIFEEHEIESAYAIQVPDKEFERIFAFFGEFQWHLDDREQGDPNAINPDVLGYIFERYINVTTGGQREGGAYYTKEDVTGYMASVTLLPRLLERFVDSCGINPFLALQERPRRYIPESLLHGADASGLWLPLPDAVISASIDPLRWVELDAIPADRELQLPDESWVETLDRREHVADLLTQIQAGDIHSIDGLISSNLDIRTLVADAIHALDTPADIAEAWAQATDTTIIDPTCGSGAFLFAILDLLDEVYAALLERARTHLNTGSAGATDSLEKLVATADEHPNDAYYRRKHAALSNLYGVDIMHEAIETAKLRLFLSLVAKLESRGEIEPLPDLDFNLRVGNILVGFGSIDDARKRVGMTTIDALTAIDAFLPRAQQVADARAEFVAAQRSGDHELTSSLKHKLTALLDDVREDADHAYAAAASVDHGARGYSAWYLTSHPFHWLLEFPAILDAGGFDVVVGNPPYIKRRTVDYTIDGYATAGLPDIYAPCLERSLDLLAPRGRFSMILPISFQFADGHRLARERVLDQGAVWVSTYSRNPSALFTAGLGVRSTIVITSPNPGPIETTSTRRWQREARESLFDTTRYSKLSDRSRSAAWFARTGDQGVADLLEGLTATRSQLGTAVRSDGAWALGYKTTALYYLPVYTRVPDVYDRQLQRVDPPTDSRISFASEDDRYLAYALLAGEISALWWFSTGDDFHITGKTLKSFPIGFDRVESIRSELIADAKVLEDIAHQPANLLFTPYNGLMTGSWDLRRVRSYTRAIDLKILRALDLEDQLPAVLRAVARFGKSTGERPGTQRGTDWVEGRRQALEAGST